MKRAALILFLLSFVLQMPAAHSVTEMDGAYQISHSWSYKSDSWHCNLSIGKDLYDYYRLRRIHQSNSNNLAGFVLSDFDSECLRDLVKNFREAGRKSGYSDYDNVYNVVAFVQSFAYVSDSKSKGQLEYVRYPVETLIDGMGDCEDTSILMAAILREMGYGVVLLSMPNHLALGVKGDHTLNGSYFVYGNERYYYLETTDKGWALGEIPKQYARSDVRVIPLDYFPQLVLKSYELQSEDYDAYSAVFRINCKIENAGPGSAHNPFLHVMAKTGNTMLAEQFFDFDTIDEGVSGEVVVRIRVPRANRVVFELQCAADGVSSNALQSRVLDLR